jgi:hypothetical protein
MSPSSSLFYVFPCSSRLPVFHYQANRSLAVQQAAFYLALGAIPASIFIYSISRADEDGKLTGMSSLIDKYTQMQETWAERNARRTAAVEQAAFDKHLLYNAPRNKHIDLKFPEYV